LEIVLGYFEPKYVHRDALIVLVSFLLKIISNNKLINIYEYFLLVLLNKLEQIKIILLIYGNKN
jgi:hypothetical protein